MHLFPRSLLWKQIKNDSFFGPHQQKQTQKMTFLIDVAKPNDDRQHNSEKIRSKSQALEFHLMCKSQHCMNFHPSGTAWIKHLSVFFSNQNEQKCLIKKDLVMRNPIVQLSW